MTRRSPPEFFNSLINLLLSPRWLLISNLQLYYLISIFKLLLIMKYFTNMDMDEPFSHQVYAGGLSSCNILNNVIRLVGWRLLDIKIII